MTMDPRLVREVETWIASDPDPAARAELQDLLDDGNEAALRERFGPPLEFGTAGIRAPLGAGPSRMNRQVVTRVTAGICGWLLEVLPDGAARRVVVGFDGRRMSRELAADAASVVTGAGFEAHVFAHAVPTPLVAYSLGEIGASAGIVVTASHNPATDNGIKVYGPDGAQIVPPDDRLIGERFRRIKRTSEVPRLTTTEARSMGSLTTIDATLEDRYVALCASAATSSASPGGLRIAYTALHGTGERFVRAALARAGFSDVVSVEAQAMPDPAFSTVRSPNPEDPGALERVLALARDHDADLVLANDPDADRLAVAVRHGGAFVTLSGNEVGCLLGEHVLATGRTGPRRAVLSTIVSSPMLGAIAAAHGAHWEATLTGHKWIHHRAMELEAEGLTFVYGFEEALGYAVSSRIRDKDGIAAAVAVADMAALHRREGRTLVDAFEALCAHHGVFVGRSRAYPLGEDARRAEIVDGLDGFFVAPPSTIAGVRVLEARDHRDGGHGLPPAELLELRLEGDHRATLRPSGTEPKLKIYIDVRIPLDGGAIADKRAEGERLAAAMLDEIAASLAL